MQQSAVRVTVQMLESELEDIRELARREGVSANDIVRTALITYKDVSDAVARSGEARVRRAPVPSLGGA